VEPPVVTSEITGGVITDLDTFRRRLGLTAFEVWVAFLWRRNRDGHSFASARSISRAKKLPYTSVRRACAKLLKFYLIKEGRWITNDSGLKRFRRTVLGDYRNGIILIPDTSKTRLAARKTWGGAREGAGRPYKTHDEPPRVSSYIQDDTTPTDIRVITNIQDDTTSIQVGRTLSSMLKRDINYPLKGIMREDFAPDNSDFFDRVPTFEPNSLDRIPPVLAESLLVASNNIDEGRHEKGDERLLETPSRDFLQNQIVDHNEDRKHMRSDKEDIRETPYIQVGHGSNPDNGKSVPMPPYPSSGFIGVPKIPPPPVLSDDLSDEDCVKKLAEAYRGAFESRYNKRSHVLTRGSLKKNKYYTAFVEAAHFMRDNDVAPASWALFMFDNAAHEGKKNKPPTINRVFNPKTLDNFLSWFNREANSYGGGRLLFTDAHKDILRRYEGLRRDAHKEKLTNTLIEKWFPDGWESHYEKAKKETAKDQARLCDIVCHGGFVW
jgi:hypothetical protein